MDIQWLFQGLHSSELVAVFAHASFLPLPAFSHRVTHIPVTGIALSQVVVADTGNYSVQITGHNSTGSFFTLRREMTLQVAG